ncbi:MAG: thiamine pyrophosphate-dependent dehydrogenase E1 component subunit alpha [Eubacteriales bacterium]|nr:thiamine pyrophosphate-dependent dehydrogenase E1 component subunit alpha [Eubacteriales bacterium]
MKTDNKNFYKELMLRMCRVRQFEEEVKRLYGEGAVHGTLHLCMGEEAVDVGSTYYLKDGDYVFATHRGHGICIGRGVDLSKMMAEILGRSTGTNFGRGGSMHICDIDKGIIGCNGVVGANAPTACGAALSIKLKKEEDRVAVCFTGDGAANTGALLESMNLAGVWKLPVIFVLIENHYAVSTVVERASADTDFTKRAEPFGLGCFETDGNDVLSVAETMEKARRFVIENKKPCLVVEHTYRVSGHSRSDQNKYRSPEEIQYWDEHGPINRFTDSLISEGLFTEAEINSIKSQAEAEMKAAVEFAVNSPAADEEVSGLLKAVYAD